MIRISGSFSLVKVEVVEALYIRLNWYLTVVESSTEIEIYVFVDVEELPHDIIS